MSEQPTRKRPRKEIKGEKSELEMTSMIDVVFLLLIFFMCATKFKIPEGQLRAFLPRNRGTQGGPPTITTGCRITLIEDQGRVLCLADDREIMEGEPGNFEIYRDISGPDMGMVREHIQDRKLNYQGLGDKGLPVIIDFGDKVPWKYVVDVVDICKELEIRDLSFAAPEIPIE